MKKSTQGNTRRCASKQNHLTYPSDVAVARAAAFRLTHTSPFLHQIWCKNRNFLWMRRHIIVTVWPEELCLLQYFMCSPACIWTVSNLAVVRWKTELTDEQKGVPLPDIIHDTFQSPSPDHRMHELLRELPHVILGVLFYSHRSRNPQWNTSLMPRSKSLLRCWSWHINRWFWCLCYFFSVCINRTRNWHLVTHF